MNERRSLLVRHGPSAQVHAGWIDVQEFRAWRAAYEAAGISESERPPLPLAQSIGDASLVLASDAPRAIASARLLASGRRLWSRWRLGASGRCGAHEVRSGGS